MFLFSKKRKHNKSHFLRQKIRFFHDSFVYASLINHIQSFKSALNYMPIVPFQTTYISTIPHVPRLCCHYLFPAQWDYSAFQLFFSFLNKCSPIHLYTAARQAYNLPFLTETLFKFPLLIHLNKYLLSTYYMTVSFLPADHTVINKINKVHYTELPSETWLRVKYWSWELKVPAKRWG